MNTTGKSVAQQPWSRTVALERSNAKLELVIKWLGWFDYSDRETLTSMLGVSRNGQNAFFNRLEASGFVKVDKAPGIRRVIYTLGDAGFEYALVLLPNLDLKRRKRLPSWVTLIHTLSVQSAIIARLPLIADIKPEKTLKHLRAVRLPDAIITQHDGAVIALEVELNHKSSSRVYSIFLSHLKNIRNRNYDQVEYIFPNDALRNLYQEKFDQPIWPIYRAKAGSTKLELDERQSFTATGIHDLNHFRFVTEELFSL